MFIGIISKLDLFRLKTSDRPNQKSTKLEIFDRNSEEVTIAKVPIGPHEFDILTLKCCDI